MVPYRSSPVPLRPVVRLSRSPDWADVTPPTTYGHSVAVGLASLRRSHVHTAIRLARLRCPVRLLECPDRASLLRPGGLRRATQLSRRRGRRRLQASFRRAWDCTFWRLGFRQSELSPYRADLPARHPVRLGTTAGFLGRGRLPGEVPFTALFPDSPLPNPPCEFPRHGLSGDYAVSKAAMCSA